jgi:hypothetical protein
VVTVLEREHVEVCEIIVRIGDEGASDVYHRILIFVHLGVKERPVKKQTGVSGIFQEQSVDCGKALRVAPFLEAHGKLSEFCLLHLPI